MPSSTNIVEVEATSLKNAFTTQYENLGLRIPSYLSGLNRA